MDNNLKIGDIIKLTGLSKVFYDNNYPRLFKITNKLDNLYSIESLDKKTKYTYLPLINRNVVIISNNKLGKLLFNN